MRIRAALFLLLVACSRTEPPAAPEPTLQLPREVNLVELGRGATVVDRTGEYSLQSSAVHAIDGDPESRWFSPPGGAGQTVQIALPARSRIRRLGLRSDSNNPVRQLRVESSLDGARWSLAGTLSFDGGNDTQLRDVTPFEARHLRLRTIAAEGQRFASVGTFHASGDELEPAGRGSIDGCWTINGRPSRFVRDGASVAGVIGGDAPIHVAGGFDGRTYRLAWRSNANWGYAILSVAPDSQAISGMRWHERVNAVTAGEGWFGKRTSDCAQMALDPDSVAKRFLSARMGYPLYGLRFDDRDGLVAADSTRALELLAQLVTGLTKTRVVAHEFRGATTEENRRRAAARLEAVRTALVARGVDMRRVEFVNAADQPRGEPVWSPPQKLLWGAIEIETPSLGP